MLVFRRVVSVFFEPLAGPPDFFVTDYSRVARNGHDRFDYLRFKLLFWAYLPQQLVSLHQNRIGSFHTHHLVDDIVLRVGEFAADFFFLISF